MHNRIIEKPVAELFLRIEKEKLDGELHIQDAQFTKVLYFQKGLLQFARTTVIQERLGEILYKLGMINQTQFWSLHKLMEGRKGKLGQILLQENMVSPENLHLALENQVIAIAVGALTLNSGTWTFSALTITINEDSRFGIPIARVISTGISRISNLAYFRNRFYETLPRQLPLEEIVLKTLDTGTRALYNRLPELQTLPCGGLAGHLGCQEDDCWTKLVHIYLVNGLEFVEQATRKKGIDQNVEALLSLYNRIAGGTADHYQILGVKDSAEESEIKSAYFTLAKQLHPDRLAGVPDPEIKEKANFVFAAINKAFDTLSDPQRRSRYDTGEGDEDDPDGRTKSNLKERARMLYQKAKTLYGQHRFWEASSLMDEAVGLDGDKSPYYLLLGMAQLHIQAQRRSAERNLKRAVEIDPWNSDAFAGLGLLFQEENLVNRAEGFYRKALSINPDHKIARRRLDEMTGGKTKKRSFFGKKK